MKKKPPADYIALAKARGFVCLDPNMPATRTKTGWRCGFGHEWQATYDNVRQGSSCPYCSGKARKTPADYIALAKARGFTCLDPDAPNVLTKTLWRCEFGHEWMAKYDTIRRGRGCPDCNNESQRNAPANYIVLAVSLGFEWLGPEVPNAGTKTGWRCGFGHEWMARYHSIQQGTGCPQCNQPKGERIIRDALTRLYIPFEAQKRFRQCRGKGGLPLPFDFCFHYDGRTILVEYDGAQHYEPNDYFGGEESFALRQEHDAIKDDFAKRKGYTLIRIPYTVEQIETYLIQAIADAVGKSFEEVAFPQPKPPQTLPASRRLSSQPPSGIQLPMSFSAD